MEAARAIQHGDTAILCANEHQILYEIELRFEDCSTEHEDYMTYWIASHKDKEVATGMFEVFMNTCSTAFNLDTYEEVMGLYAHPTMIGAVATKNLEILDLLKGYIKEADVEEEMIAQYGETFS